MTARCRRGAALVAALCLVACVSASSQTQTEARATALEGTPWRLTHLGKTAVAPSPDGREASLEFQAASGQVVGSTGCNRLSGRYTRTGTRLSLGPLVTTKMACIGQEDLEARFLAALERVATYRVAGGSLELSGASGELLARFEPKR